MTISGDSQTVYWLFVENENLDAEEYPTIRDGQAGVTTDPVAEVDIPDFIDYADENPVNAADGTTTVLVPPGFTCDEAV